MVLVYGEAVGNGRAARRIYQKRYPHVRLRFIPCSPKLFNGLIVVLREGVALPTLKRTLRRVEETRQRVPETLRLEWVCLTVPSGRICMSRNYILTIPRRYMQCVRANFFMWFLHRCVEEPKFPRQILFTDERRFTRDAILNTWNSHVWDDENPHAQHAHGYQQRFGINMWACIVDGRLIGPYLLPPHLTSHTYLSARSIGRII